MNVEEKIKLLLSEQLFVSESEITSKTRLGEDLGADSLDVVEIVMLLEEEFDLEISDDDVKTEATFQDVLDYVNKRAKEAA